MKLGEKNRQNCFREKNDVIGADFTRAYEIARLGRSCPSRCFYAYIGNEIELGSSFVGQSESSAMT
jgi:hypothetical protein